MNVIDTGLDAPDRVAGFLLVGSSLNNIQVYSASIVLCFTRLRQDQKPDQVWLTSTGRIIVYTSRGLAAYPDLISSDARGIAICLLCRLIAEDVVSVNISTDGSLTVRLSNSEFTFDMDDVNSEEVWSVTSDSPSPNHRHTWSVTLDDSGKVVVHTPG